MAEGGGVSSDGALKPHESYPFGNVARPPRTGRIVHEGVGQFGYKPKYSYSSKNMAPQ